MKLEKVLEIDPTYSLTELVLLYWMTGKLDKTVALLRKYIALDPGKPRTLALLAGVYLDLGDDVEAEYWIRRSMQLASFKHRPNEGMAHLHMYRGEAEEALNYARKDLIIDPTGQNIGDVLDYVQNQGLLTDGYAEARARYEQNSPALLNEDAPKIDRTNFFEALGLAFVLLKTGEHERANMLLDRSLTAMPDQPWLVGTGYGQIADVRIYALQGETKTALAVLRQAIDEGWRNEWWVAFQHDPYLDSIRDEPEFQAMMGEVRADMAAQLERVRAMEANGELEPIPDIN